MSLYNNDIASYIENLEYIEQELAEYVVIAPSYMVYTQDYKKLLNDHIESGADITLLYHSVDTAKEYFLNCYALNLNKQKEFFLWNRITEMQRIKISSWILML